MGPGDGKDKDKGGMGRREVRSWERRECLKGEKDLNDDMTMTVRRFT